MVLGFSSKALDMGSLIQMLHENQASFCHLYTNYGILDAFQITSMICVAKSYFGFSTTSYLGTLLFLLSFHLCKMENLWPLVEGWHMNNVQAVQRNHNWEVVSPAARCVG